MSWSSARAIGRVAPPSSWADHRRAKASSTSGAGASPEFSCPTESSHHRPTDAYRYPTGSTETIPVSSVTWVPVPFRTSPKLVENNNVDEPDLLECNSPPLANSPPSPAAAMGFLRNIAGVLIAVPLAYAISTATDLQESAAVAILVQWVVAVLYAVPKQDETFFDLTGALTHATVSLLAFTRTESKTWRKALLTAMVWFWCVRLGSFLYLRIRKAGEDVRFVDIRGNPLRFFSVWTIQGLWVFLTLIPVLLSQRHSVSGDEVHPLDIVGATLWVLGYVIEVLADYQKTKFRADPRNKDKFIQQGLWNYSRHPNYFGEILMWIGIFFITVHGLPTTFLQGMAAFGPAFVTLLLLKVSGVPLLEKHADKTWGKLESYQTYKRQTSVLILWPKKA